MVKELQAKSDQDNARSMRILGCCYAFGKRGLAKDQVQARTLFQRATELGDVEGMAFSDASLLEGVGGPSAFVLGMLYTSQAAERGSAAATLYLGMAFMKGLYGLLRDSAQAKRHLCQVFEEKCEVKDLT